MPPLAPTRLHPPSTTASKIPCCAYLWKHRPGSEGISKDSPIDGPQTNNECLSIHLRHLIMYGAVQLSVPWLRRERWVRPRRKWRQVFCRQAAYSGPGDCRWLSWEQSLLGHHLVNCAVAVRSATGSHPEEITIVH